MIKGLGRGGSRRASTPCQGTVQRRLTPILGNIALFLIDAKRALAACCCRIRLKFLADSVLVAGWSAHGSGRCVVFMRPHSMMRIVLLLLLMIPSIYLFILGMMALL